jgi:hypothetical protein
VWAPPRSMASGSSWASMSPSPRFRFIWCPGGIDHCDLFVVPTIAFQHLFAFLVLSHERRRLLRFAVTRNPTAEWLARQITEAFPWDSTPKYLIRDNARAFGVGFKARVRAMGIRDRPTSFRSPWQNGYTESLIDSIRRECTDHLIVFNAEHFGEFLRNTPSITMRYGLTFSSGRRRPARARSSCSETLSLIRSSAGYTSISTNLTFSEATPTASIKSIAARPSSPTLSDSVTGSNGRSFRHTQATTAEAISLRRTSELSLLFLRENHVPVVPISFRNGFLAFAPTIAGG